jgi:hypothetical protein
MLEAKKREDSQDIMMDEETSDTATLIDHSDQIDHESEVSVDWTEEMLPSSLRSIFVEQKNRLELGLKPLPALETLPLSEVVKKIHQRWPFSVKYLE